MPFFAQITGIFAHIIPYFLQIKLELPGTRSPLTPLSLKITGLESESAWLLIVLKRIDKEASTHHDDNMRTTVDINDAQLQELRRRASELGRPFRHVLMETLALGLAQVSKGRSTRRFRLHPHPLGLKPGFRGMSLNQLYDQLEAEDIAPKG